MIKPSQLFNNSVLLHGFSQPSVYYALRLLREDNRIPNSRKDDEFRPVDLAMIIYILCSENAQRAITRIDANLKFIYDLAERFSPIYEAIKEDVTGFEYIDRVRFISKKNLDNLDKIIISEDYQVIVLKDKTELKYCSNPDFKEYKPISATILSRWFLMAVYFDVITQFKKSFKLFTYTDAKILDEAYSDLIMGNKSNNWFENL